MRRLAMISIVLALCAGCAQTAPVYDLPVVSLDNASFYPTVEANTQASIVAGNKVDLLLNGDEFFPAMLAAIRSARVSIDLAEYVFEKPGIAGDFADALAERCRAGVGVNVLLDSAGSLNVPPEYVDRMKASGCRVQFFRPLRPWQIFRVNHRLHRRILVVDGRVGFTGGFGISEQWTGNGRSEGRWRDTAVRMEGPAVHELQAAFAGNWRQETGVVIGGAAYFPRLRPAGDVAVQVVASSPVGGSFDAYMLFLLAIEAARRSIDIANPYFVPDDRMRAAVLGAVRRGVRVRILLPGKIDHRLVRELSHKHLGDLLRGGVEVWQYDAALLHAKTIVIDGVWATVGSTNFDNRSFALNDELNVTMYDAGFATRLGRSFEEDLRHSSAITYEAWKRRPLVERVLELLVLPAKSQL